MCLCFYMYEGHVFIICYASTAELAEVKITVQIEYGNV